MFIPIISCYAKNILSRFFLSRDIGAEGFARLDIWQARSYIPKSLSTFLFFEISDVFLLFSMDLCLNLINFSSERRERRENSRFPSWQNWKIIEESQKKSEISKNKKIDRQLGI